MAIQLNLPFPEGIHRIVSSSPLICTWDNLLWISTKYQLIVSSRRPNHSPLWITLDNFVYESFLITSYVQFCKKLFLLLPPPLSLSHTYYRMCSLLVGWNKYALYYLAQPIYPTKEKRKKKSGLCNNVVCLIFRLNLICRLLSYLEDMVFLCRSKLMWTTLIHTVGSNKI